MTTSRWPEVVSGLVAPFSMVNRCLSLVLKRCSAFSSSLDSMKVSLWGPLPSWWITGTGICLQVWSPGTRIANYWIPRVFDESLEKCSFQAQCPGCLVFLPEFPKFREVVVVLRESIPSERVEILEHATGFSGHEVHGMNLDWLVWFGSKKTSPSCS